jgi:hypothetical protein
MRVDRLRWPNSQRHLLLVRLIEIRPVDALKKDRVYSRPSLRFRQADVQQWPTILPWLINERKLNEALIQGSRNQPGPPHIVRQRLLPARRFERASVIYEPPFPGGL